MPSYYIDVAPTGDRVRASAHRAGHDDPKVVIFNDQQAIAMPAHANALAISPDGRACLVRGQDDRTYRVLRTGEVVDVDSAAGSYCVGYSPAGIEYWIRSPSTYVVGGIYEKVPRDASGDYIYGQGWTQIGADGVPAWTAFVSPRKLDGRVLTRPVEKGGWLTGMETVAPDRILAVHLASKAWFSVWAAETPIGPTLAIVDGEPRVGISLPGVVIPRSKFATIGPTPPPKSRLIWRGLNGFASDGSVERQVGNFVWAQPPSARPALEGMPWAADITGKMLVVLVGTEKDHKPYPNKAAQIAATVKEAKRRKCAVGVYSDDPEWTPGAEAIADTVAAQGVAMLRVVQAYLQAGESPADAQKRVQRQVSKVRGVGQVGLMQRADTNGVCSPAELEQFTALCEDIIENKDNKALVLQAVFGVRRPSAVQAVIDDLSATIKNMPAGAPPPLVPPVPPPPNPFWNQLRSLPMVEFGYLKSRWYYIGVDPNNTSVVYSDRTAAGGWEKVEITQLDNGRYTVRFVDANVMFSQQPDGHFETRPAGTVGEFEQLDGGEILSGPLKGRRILGSFVVEPA